MIKLKALQIACLTIASWTYSDPIDRRDAQKVCVDVALEAQSQTVPVDEALALAWAESRFQPNETSNVGAKGPMQVLPKWWCEKKKKCDYVEAGVRALKVFKRLFPGFKNAVCHYNSGVDKTCPLKSIGFADAVDGYRKRIKRELKK